jgi:hypothetical protein
VLRRFFDLHPELWSKYGNMAAYTNRVLAEAFSGGDWIVSQAVLHEADKMRRELAGPSPSPLESLAVERVITTWLRLGHTETQFMGSLKDLGWAKYWLHRMELADKQFRAAVKSLALVRGLLVGRPDAAQDIPASKVPLEAERQPAAEESLPVYGGVNRVAALLARSGYPPASRNGKAIDGIPKANGRRHRTAKLLEPARG